MMLNVKKMHKKNVLFIVTAVIAVSLIGTSTAAWAAKYVPVAESSKETSLALNHVIQANTVYSEINAHGGVRPREWDSSDIHNEAFMLEEGVEYVKKAELEEIKVLEENSSSFRLIAVRPSDEQKFSPEEWQNILAQIERGEVFWEDSEEFIEIKASVLRGDLTWDEVFANQSQ